MAGRAPMIGSGKGVGVSGGPVPGNSLLLRGAIGSVVGLGNLKINVDAGDIASWPGGGGQWLDSSGNGNHFNLGTGSGADAADPTFNGTPGAFSANEMWTFDGGDCFALSAANPPVIDSLHQNNTLATLIFILDLTSMVLPAGAVGLAGTVTGSGNGTGFFINVGTDTVTGGITLVGLNTNSPVVGPPRSTVALMAAGLNIVAISINEAAGAGGSFYYRNKVAETFNATNSNPAFGPASQPLRLGCLAAGQQLFGPQDRLIGFAALDTNLSVAQMDGIFEAIKPRFPTLP